MNKIAERALASNSNSVKRLNPHVFKGEDTVYQFTPKIKAALEVGPYNPTHTPKPAKRIRQSSKPALNKLEQEWFDYLTAATKGYGCAPLRAQAKRYQIGNGSWYKPDVTCSDFYHKSGTWSETAWEVKGPKQMKGIARGMVVLKAAAHQWPEVRFILVWKEGNEWKEQVVLP